jgi:hypothetical protein
MQAWSLLISGAAYWMNAVRTHHGDGPANLMSAGTSIIDGGAFRVAAWVLIVVSAGSSAPRGSASPILVMGAVATGLLCVVPTSLAIVAALAVLALTCGASTASRYGRSVTMLLACLAFELAAVSAYTFPIHDMVATLDARICALVLDPFGWRIEAHGNVLENLPDGWSVELLAPCASSFPLAGVVLAFVVSLLYCGRTPRAVDMPWLGLSLISSVALTEVRLSLMAVDKGLYTWLHDGDGSVVYSLCAVSLAVLFPLLAAVRSRPLVEVAA